MTGPKDIAIAALAGMLVLAGIGLAFQEQAIGKLKAENRLYEQREKEWESQIRTSLETIQDLRLRLDKQNSAVRLAADMGAEAQKAQRLADQYSARLARAEEKLEMLYNERTRFENRIIDASVVETYELALRSIAGEDI